MYYVRKGVAVGLRPLFALSLFPALASPRFLLPVKIANTHVS